MLMIDPGHVKKILEINGVSTESSDDSIRSVLLSARYNKDEIDTALLVLRQDNDTNEVRVEGLHKVFRTNQALAPKEISQLLGIEVNASGFVEPGVATRTPSKWQFFFVWFLSVAFAACGMLFFMHMSQIGPFHPSVA